MSENQALTETASEIEFEPENLLSAENLPEQPLKTDVEELIEIFSTYKNKSEALQAMRNGLVGEGKDKRFSANGKTYSQANCRKAINRIDEKGLFKDQVKTPEAQDLTFKMDAPPLPPRQEPPQEAETSYTADDDQSFTELPNEPEPAPEQSYQQPTPQAPQPRVCAEPSTRIVKSYTFIAKTICNKLSSAVKDPEMKQVFAMDDKEAQEVGYAIAVLTVDENGMIDPKTAAIGVLLTAIISRILPYVPKLLEKLKKGGSKQ